MADVMKSDNNTLSTEDISRDNTIINDKAEDGRIRTDEQGFEADTDTLPKGYYYSPFFVGTCFAVGLGFLAGNSGFAYAAPLLATINQDIGPSPDISWVALIHPVALSVGITIIGRLGDLFGRRWFFIGGAVVAMIGTVISALAVNVPMLIVGSTIKSLAAGTQLSCYYAMGELVPVKYRYFIIGALNIWQLPGQGFAPVIARSVERSARVGWRAVFWMLTAFNGASLICYVLFYHPPNFREKWGIKESKKAFIKKFDYIGTLLYCVGLVFFLLGLSWGGARYPWNSSMPISFIVVGFVALVSFVLWECYAKLEEPLVPIALFKNRHWVVSVILSGLAAGVYYAGALIWPPLTLAFWSGGDVMKAAYLACLSNLGILVGGSLGGIFAKPIGYQKYQIVVAMSICGALLAAMSTSSPDTQARSSAMMFFAAVAAGWTADIAIGNVVIAIADQRQIGAAGGAATSGRTAVAAVCQTIYNVVLTNRRLQAIPAAVSPAVTQAGLPRTSVAAVLAALAAGTE